MEKYGKLSIRRRRQMSHLAPRGRNEEENNKEGERYFYTSDFVSARGNSFAPIAEMRARNENRLTAARAALVVVDMQERLIPAMDGRDALVAACEKLVRGSRILGLPAIFTQQYTKGLGGTMPALVQAATETEAAPSSPFDFVEKTSFSVLGEPAFPAALEAAGVQSGTPIRDILLCGVESHVCVLQSALDLRDAGYRVYLAVDAVSSRTDTDRRFALKRMAGSGIVLTTVETLLFELLGGAGHPAFRGISKLVK